MTVGHCEWKDRGVNQHENIGRLHKEGTKLSQVGGLTD